MLGSECTPGTGPLSGAELQRAGGDHKAGTAGLYGACRLWVGHARFMPSVLLSNYKQVKPCHFSNGGWPLCCLFVLSLRQEETALPLYGREALYGQEKLALVTR